MKQTEKYKIDKKHGKILIIAPNGPSNIGGAEKIIKQLTDFFCKKTNRFCIYY